MYPRVLSHAVVVLLALTAMLAAIFAMREPFDVLQQKRMFILSSENVHVLCFPADCAEAEVRQITSHEQYLRIGTADSAPGLDNLVERVAAEFGTPDACPIPEVMHDWNGNWDIIYPFSSFMSPYKIALPSDPAYVSPFAPGGTQAFTVEAVNDVVDVWAGTRSLTIKVTHPDVIWTGKSIAFDAHVLKWTLDNSPPDEHMRHHINEGSFDSVDTWSLDLVVHIPDDAPNAVLKVNCMGVRENECGLGR
ncbi:hypothetical protein EWM64_g9662 [Hericium alpestre]|uniref:Uncharacterized protein n=1 Tax=Hericium alpestre TaxID=135208 RepID=A0A4Y9ZI75_9AGAM|nr:hypothetical protein EWM64_g9662 [Hericium alpestre]